MRLKKVLTNPLSGLTLAAAVTLVFNSHQVLAEESNAVSNSIEVVEVATLDATVANEETSTVNESDSSSDSAHVANDVAAIEKDHAIPFSVDSNEIINVQPVWDTKYKGEGTIVAIIDSGLDIEHDVLKITDMSKAKYKNEAELNAAKEKAGIDYGKWYSDKVIFGYNYSDADEELKEENEASHGMHVAGIATGNPVKEDEATSRLIYGVAPEAQLIFMRVFSDRIGPSTSSTLYSRAIRDAVQLGADSINLSLGGGSGSLNDVDEDVIAAIEYARRSGVSVVIAAGNDGYFGEGRNLPKADSPDYGVVADPAVARDSIAVASFNNGTTVAEALTVVGGEQNENFDKGNVPVASPTIVNVRFEANREYDYEFVGLGQPEDLEGKDLSGKVALIKRGAITFNDKIRNAQAKGAIGVVVFDHTPGASLLIMSLEESAAEIPSLMISSETGEELAKNAGTYKLKFSDKPLLLTSKKANQFSDFTSWGLSADGELKPDVSAPGGDIYSSINDGKYSSMSGTSMAAPHVAGAAALLKQVYKEKYPEVTGAEMEALIKHMLMSTATPHVDLETQAYTSPRRQGAGVVNVEKAANSTLYVTGMDDYGSVSLGNVTDTLTFNVKVYNISDQPRELEYVTHLNTDNVSEGRIALTPRELTTVEGARITVPAKGHVVVPITVSAAQFAEELSKAMPNGYYLEGFVRFLNPSDKSHLASIPFVGFRGDFQAIPVLEKPIYDFADDEAPFYYDRNPQDPGLVSYVPEYSFYTALISTVADEDPEAHTNSTPSLVTLGSFENEDNNGRFYLKRYDNGKPVLAVSPNGDGNRDDIGFQGVFLRNSADIHIRVYAKDDTEQTTPLWESDVTAAYKNYFSGNPQNERATFFSEDEMVFSGYDSQGNKLADGEYKYVVTYYPHIPGADQQRQEFDLVIDTVQPVVPKGGTYDETSRQFKPYKVTDDRTGIYRERIYYFETVEGQKVRFYVEKNEDGTYTLPSKNSKEEELTNDKFWFEAEDLAGNRQTVNVGLLIEVGHNAGVLTVQLVDHETMEPVSRNYRYIIRTSNGEVIASDSRVGDKAGTTHRLPYGTYDISLLLFDESGVKLADKRVKRVTITEDDAEQELVFKVEVLRRALTRIEFPSVMPADTHVFLVDAEGNSIELPQARYNGAQFEKRVLLGEYSVVVTLPAGYFLDKEDLVYTIDGEERHIKSVTVNAKGNLAQEGAATTYDATLPKFDETSPESFGINGTSVTYDSTLPKFDETAAESFGINGAGVTYDSTLPKFDETATESLGINGTGVTYDSTLPKFDETATESLGINGASVTYELPHFDETATESFGINGTSVTHDSTLPTFDEESSDTAALVGTGVTYELPRFDENSAESIGISGTGVTYDSTLPTYDATSLSRVENNTPKSLAEKQESTQNKVSATKSGKASQASLPETGESSPLGLLSTAILTVLAGLGLAKFKKDEERA